MSFTLRFYGTGDAFNTGGRGSQCLHVRAADGSSFLVDCGPTAVMAMEREGVEPRSVDRVFFTHHHGDHIGGWPFFLLHNMYAKPRTAPLDVHGSAGLEDRLAKLSTACYGEVLTPERIPFAVRYHEIPVAASSDLVTAAGDLRFDVVPMDHDPSSIGYRFRSGGSSFAITGDTRWCAGLEELARGVDRLVMECTTVHPHDHAHVSLDELREKRSRLAAKRILLVHTLDAVAEALAVEPIAGVGVASDGGTVAV